MWLFCLLSVWHFTCNQHQELKSLMILSAIFSLVRMSFMPTSLRQWSLVRSLVLLSPAAHVSRTTEGGLSGIFTPPGRTAFWSVCTGEHYGIFPVVHNVLPGSSCLSRPPGGRSSTTHDDEGFILLNGCDFNPNPKVGCDPGVNSWIIFGELKCQRLSVWRKLKATLTALLFFYNNQKEILKRKGLFTTD